MERKDLYTLIGSSYARLAGEKMIPGLRSIYIYSVCPFERVSVDRNRTVVPSRSWVHRLWKQHKRPETKTRGRSVLPLV